MGPEDAQGVATSGSLLTGFGWYPVGSRQCSLSYPLTSNQPQSVHTDPDRGTGGGWRDGAVIEQLFVFKGGTWETGNQEARTYLRGWSCPSSRSPLAGSRSCPR